MESCCDVMTLESARNSSYWFFYSILVLLFSRVGVTYGTNSTERPIGHSRTLLFHVAHGGDVV